MSQPFVQVDAFTHTPFAGNPAAICILPAARDAAWMQAVAREMNLSETAFLIRRPDGDDFDLRWFTPTVEVPLCGHATLASAHALWEGGALDPNEQARFHTRSGLLTADRTAGGWIELDFPVDPVEPASPPPDLLDAVGEDGAPVAVLRSAYRYLFELKDEAAVRALAPDMGRIAAVPIQGLIVTARGAEGAPYDFVSRYFAPAAGVPEDPVTGSAHCSLTPYWAERLGRSVLTAHQASARGGDLRLRLVGDRVKIAGRAVTVARGDLLV